MGYRIFSPKPHCFPPVDPATLHLPPIFQFFKFKSPKSLILLCFESKYITGQWLVQLGPTWDTKQLTVAPQSMAVFIEREIRWNRLHVRVILAIIREDHYGGSASYLPLQKPVHNTWLYPEISLWSWPESCAKAVDLGPRKNLL